MPRSRKSSRLDDAPSVADLTAIADPIARAARITAFAKHYRTLPRALAHLRIQALREAQAAGRKVVTIAFEVDLSVPRVSQLINADLPVGESPQLIASAATAQ